MFDRKNKSLPENSGIFAHEGTHVRNRTCHKLSGGNEVKISSPITTIMKYFFVTNTRTYIFCNHPLDPHGTNLCLPFAMSQRNNEEWFDDKYISARTDDGLLVFAQVIK